MNKANEEPIVDSDGVELTQYERCQLKYRNVQGEREAVDEFKTFCKKHKLTQFKEVGIALTARLNQLRRVLEAGVE